MPKLCWLNRKNFPISYLIKPVNQVIKTERIRELVGRFPARDWKASSRFLLSSKLRKCIPTRLILCSRSSKNPRVRLTFSSWPVMRKRYYWLHCVWTQIFTLKARRKALHQLEQAGLVKKSDSFSPVFVNHMLKQKTGKSGKFWTLVDESERLLTWLLAKKKKVICKLLN